MLFVVTDKKKKKKIQIAIKKKIEGRNLILQHAKKVNEIEIH